MNPFRSFLCSSSRFTIIPAIVGIMLLVAINSADAATLYVQITSKELGLLTTACTTQKGRENICPVYSYSNSIGFPVNSTLPQYGPIQIVLELNRVHPRLLDAMVKRGALTVVVDFFKQNPSTGAEYIYHTVTLNNATVIDVRRWTEYTAPLNASYNDYSTVTFDYASITETNNDGLTSFIGTKK